MKVIAPMSRRSGMSDLRSATVGNGSGTPISALGEVTLVPETAVITRRNGQRMNQILAYLDPYTLPAPVLEDYQARFAETGFHVPAGYEVVVGGEAENSSDAVGNLAAVGVPLVMVMAGAIMLVFNSFRMMLLVLASGFLSLGFAFFGVWLFNLPFGFNAIIGGLGLFGIAINGSIVESQSRSDGRRCDCPARSGRGCHPAHRGNDADDHGWFCADPADWGLFLDAAGSGNFRRSWWVGAAGAVFHARNIPHHDSKTRSHRDASCV